MIILVGERMYYIQNPKWGLHTAPILWGAWRSCSRVAWGCLWRAVGVPIAENEAMTTRVSILV
jgi:hypothetical protein